MTDQQLELGLASRAPCVDGRDVARLIELLGDGEWHSARQLTAAWTGESGEHCTDRRIRAIASASEGRIVSYPGAPGYKLFNHITEAEIAHAASALEHQGQEMIARALDLRRRHHRHGLVQSE